MLSVGTELPQRGPVCPKCGVHIPQFAELSESEAARIRHLITNQRPAMAMQELRSATGCPIAWAKIWVQQLTAIRARRCGADCLVVTNVSPIFLK